MSPSPNTEVPFRRLKGPPVASGRVWMCQHEPRRHAVILPRLCSALWFLVVPVWRTSSPDQPQAPASSGLYQITPRQGCRRAPSVPWTRALTSTTYALFLSVVPSSGCPTTTFMKLFFAPSVQIGKTRHRITPLATQRRRQPPARLPKSVPRGQRRKKNFSDFFDKTLESVS